MDRLHWWGGATIAAAAAGALAVGSCAIGYSSGMRAAAVPPPTDAEVEEEIAGNVQVTEPTGTHEITMILLPGFTGSGKHLMRWFRRLSAFGVQPRHKTVPLPCAVTACVAATVPCLSTAFEATTVPLPCVSATSAAKTVPFLADLLRSTSTGSSS